MPDTSNPAQGGSYVRDAATGELTLVEHTAPPEGALQRHAGDEPASAGAPTATTDEEA